MSDYSTYTKKQLIELIHQQYLEGFEGGEATGRRRVAFIRKVFDDEQMALEGIIGSQHSISAAEVKTLAMVQLLTIIRIKNLTRYI